MLELIAIMLLLIWIASKVFKDPKNLQKVKKLFIWNSVIRSQIQFYFPVCLIIFSQFKSSTLEPKDLPALLIKFSLLYMLPLFSYIYLRTNKKDLEKKEFEEKWGSLYTNLYPLKDSVYEVTSIFCIKRILYAIGTVYMGNYVVPNIYVYIFVPLFGLGYTINNRPMNSRVLNFMEALNELIILCNGYFVVMFTQWICDPLLRYKLGWIHIFLNLVVIAANFVIIFYEIFKGVRYEYRKWRWARQWKKKVEELESSDETPQQPVKQNVEEPPAKPKQPTLRPVLEVKAAKSSKQKLEKIEPQ